MVMTSAGAQPKTLQVAVTAGPSSPGNSVKPKRWTSRVALANTNPYVPVEYRLNGGKWQRLEGSCGVDLVANLAFESIRLRRTKQEGGEVYVDVTLEREQIVNPNARFDVPVAVATWGDSLADISNAATHDLANVTLASFDGKDMYNSRLGHQLLFQSGGLVVPVANCGLGGTTSTQILARDLAAPGPNRRGAADAANLGAKVCLVSLGRNNILTAVTTATPQATRDAILETIYADVVTAVRRVQRLGMYPVLREFAGYAWADSDVNYAKIAGRTAADVAVAVEMMNTAADYIANVIVPTLGDMTLLPIRDGLVDPVTGAWYPEYSTDGLHENRNGGREIARRFIRLVMSMAKPYVPDGPYAPLPVGAGRANGFAAPAMLTVASGYAAGFQSTAGVGTVVRTPSVVEDADATIWQSLQFTASAFDGQPKIGAPNGLASAMLAMQMATWGPSAVLSFAAGEPARVEFDIVIDDGAGGIPANVLTWFCQIAVGYPTGQFFRLRPVEQNITSGNLLVPNEVIAGKVISPPFAMPDSTANMDNGLVQVYAYVNDTKPARIRVANPRIVKYPAPK